jgi:hypothetical protein
MRLCVMRRALLEKAAKSHREVSLMLVMLDLLASLTAPSVAREVVRDSGAEVTTMVRILNKSHIVIDDHVDRSFGADSKHGDLRVLDVDHVLLAVLLRGASLLVVVEEAVHAGRIDEHVV